MRKQEKRTQSKTNASSRRKIEIVEKSMQPTRGRFLVADVLPFSVCLSLVSLFETSLSPKVLLTFIIMDTMDEDTDPYEDDTETEDNDLPDVSFYCSLDIPMLKIRFLSVQSLRRLLKLRMRTKMSYRKKQS